MTPTAEDVLDLLSDDLVSRSWVEVCIKNSGCPESSRSVREREVLEELLLSGKVEIGETEEARPDYLAFIAWNGAVPDRVSRALRRVDALTGWDRDFAYWLCLRENVDRYEDQTA